MAERAPIERGLFREAEDGTTVYFPWGLARRGYRLGDAAQRKKASQAASLLIGATLAIGTWTAHALQPLLDSPEGGAAEHLRALAAPGAALAFVVFAYALWVWRFVEDLPESDLRISKEARLREAAALVKPWKLALIGAVTCGLSGLLVWLQPRAWWMCLLGVALGIGVIFWSAALRRAAGPLPSGTDPGRR